MIIVKTYYFTSAYKKVMSNIIIPVQSVDEVLL